MCGSYGLMYIQGLSAGELEKFISLVITENLG